jgi:hypothetical protein
VAPDVIERKRARAVRRANAGVSLGTMLTSGTVSTGAGSAVLMPQERVGSPKANESPPRSASRVALFRRWRGDADGPYRKSRSIPPPIEA